MTFQEVALQLLLAWDTVVSHRLQEPPPSSNLYITTLVSKWGSYHSDEVHQEVCIHSCRFLLLWGLKIQARTTEINPLLTANTKANLFHKWRTQFPILFTLAPSHHIKEIVTSLLLYSKNKSHMKRLCPYCCFSFANLNRERKLFENNFEITPGSWNTTQELNLLQKLLVIN